MIRTNPVTGQLAATTMMKALAASPTTITRTISVAALTSFQRRLW